MRIGTKSVLVGAHQFLLHPILLAIGWWQEYGFRRVQIPHERAIDVWAASRDPEERAWAEELVALIPPTYASLLDPRLWLAFIVHGLGYVGKPNMDGPEGETHPVWGTRVMRWLCGNEWGDLVLLHSRYFAKQLGRPVSPLCHADKHVIVLEPWCLYLPRVWLSGELVEYRENARRRGLQVTGPDDPLTADEVAITFD